MLSQIIVPLAFVTELVLGGPATGASAANTVAAQSAPAQLASSSDRAERQVIAARGRVRQLSAEMRKLDATYKLQLSELDRLSRQRASWNRDRKISKQKTASQVTARKLSAAARELRTARGQLKSAKQRLLAALDRELAGALTDSTAESAPPPGAGRRRMRLARMRDTLRRELRPKPRKIVVPDIGIDATDDPDDLEEKARIIARVEAKLRREQQQLDRRYTYYSRQERLRAQRERANEIERTDSTSIRRTTGIGNSSTTADVGGASDAEADPGAPEGGLDNGGTDGDDFSDRASDLALETSSVVLADVVDDVTASDLRRASRSTNPATRARAAGKARDQVSARLQRLRRTRRAIERRARTLRK